MEEEYEFTCPHCWQKITILLDVSVPRQTFIEDCEVCCNPLEISYEMEDGSVQLFEVRGIGQ